jgi:hypothetical protein
VSNCRIGNIGASILAGALHDNTTLTELTLRENNIGDAGATALAGALHDNFILNLVNNSIGFAGRMELKAAERTHNGLRVVLDYSIWDKQGGNRKHSQYRKKSRATKKRHHKKHYQKKTRKH